MEGKNLFFKELQALLTSRALSAEEVGKYLQLIESSNMEKDAFIAIVNYCIVLKGADVPSAYILAVTKHLVQEGALSVEQVEKALTEKSNRGNDRKEEEYLIKLFRKLNPKLKKNVVDIVKGLTTSLDNK